MEKYNYGYVYILCWKWTSNLCAYISVAWRGNLTCIMLGPRTHNSPNCFGGSGFCVSTLTIRASTHEANIPIEPG